jgi:hypothetical protein
MTSPPPMASLLPTQPQDGPHASWLDLPLEVRYNILSLISRDYQAPRLALISRDYQDLHLALYATVCSEWQCFFENITFRHLTINDNSLEDFSGMMRGMNTHRAVHVRHIVLLVVLPGYSYPSCHKLENWFEIYR